jgi:hypothetical protein
MNDKAATQVGGRRRIFKFFESAPMKTFASLSFQTFSQNRLFGSFQEFA